MRSLVAAFLIPVLVALPLTQVLAQATQQEPQVTQTRESMVLLGAPVVDSNTVLLLVPASVGFSTVTDPLPVLEPSSTAIPKGGKIALIVVGALVVIGLGVIIWCHGPGPCNKG